MIYVLTCEGGDYENRYTNVIAASHDKQKVEDLKVKLIEENENKLSITAEFHRLHDDAMVENPFSIEYPIRPEGPTKMTKEALAEYHSKMADYEFECNVWKTNKREHTDKIFEAVRAEVATKFNLPIDFAFAWYDDEQVYYVEEVEEL